MEARLYRIKLVISMPCEGCGRKIQASPKHPCLALSDQHFTRLWHMQCDPREKDGKEKKD